MSSFFARFQLKVLRLVIPIFYKNPALKLYYASMLSDPESDDFSRQYGIIELLVSKGLLKTDTPICSEFIVNRFKGKANQYELIVGAGGYIENELSICADSIVHLTQQFGSDALSMLDLGCGTGLLGQMLISRGLNLIIDGVDISSEMLEVCKQKSCYRKLFCSDIISFLQDASHEYQIIAASSVIPFFVPRQLSLFSRLVSSKLQDDGFLVFTFDTCQNNYVVNDKLFCEHSTKLIKEIFLTNFLAVNISIIDYSRSERSTPVSGAICVCTNNKSLA